MVATTTAAAAAAASIQTCDGKKEYAESNFHCREACDCELRLSRTRL